MESGSREVAERWLAWLGEHDPEASVDLLTCYEGEPSNFSRFQGTVYSTFDYKTAADRLRLLGELRRNGYDTISILCTSEPIMTRWKWWAAWKVHAKVMIVNENADWLWADRGHWKTLAKFAAFRTGLSGSGALTQPLKLLLFPFTLTYLLLYAAAVHLRRKLAR